MRTNPGEIEHLDVLIVGAGLSGIGAACHLQRNCPERTYAILEARPATGGTWDLFRYPGIRSDSDMHTLGYSFRPWEQAETIADGPSILTYIRQTAADYGVEAKVRLSHRITSAEWNSGQARWTLTGERTDTGESIALTCSFLLMCCGYYRYDRAYTPDFPGTDRFPGPIIHPQHWPEDLDYRGRRVVVIGSGATAVTLVPAMAQRAAHVTLLQRSPSYIVSLPSEDGLAKLARRWLPPMAAYQAVRFKNIALMTLSYQLSRRRPRLARSLIRRGVERQLPEGYDVDGDFDPSYDPWDQRLCVCPDGDLFSALRAGTASIVTDKVQSFTESGIALHSGRHLEADVIVTATGLQLLALGGIELSVDGEPVDISQRMTYKGMMLNGVPNAALAIGYTNASWTLKCDLTCAYVCRLLNHMSERSYAYCVAENHDPSVVSAPLLNLVSGYILRSVDDFPRQGSRAPWKLYQNYALDLIRLRLGALEDGVMRFSRDVEATAPDAVSATATIPAPAAA